MRGQCRADAGLIQQRPDRLRADAGGPGPAEDAQEGVQHLFRPARLFHDTAPAHGRVFLGHVQELKPDPPGLQDPQKQTRVIAGHGPLALEIGQDRALPMPDNGLQLPGQQRDDLTRVAR